MKTTILTSKELQPTLFQPKMARHFILEVDGIDKFLIARVSRSALTIDVMQSRQLEFWMHDAIAPNAMQHVREVIAEGRKSSSNIKVSLKELDPIGAVISLTSWEYCRIVRVELPAYDYSKDGIQQIGVTMELGPETFHY